MVVHVQRTGGTSLRRMIEMSVGPQAVFPSTERLRDNHDGRYVTPREIIQNWQSLPPHRFLFGHCLASLSDLLPHAYSRATIVRDPIERSISILQFHAQSSGRLVSELVRDQQFLDSHITDLQTRIFGTNSNLAVLRPQETPTATDEVLEQALTRLQTFEYIGFTEEYSSSLERFDSTFGTSLCSSKLHVNQSHTGDADHGVLAERLAPLVARDRALYDFAVEFVHKKSPTVENSETVRTHDSSGQVEPR